MNSQKIYYELNSFNELIKPDLHDFVIDSINFHTDDLLMGISNSSNEKILIRFFDVIDMIGTSLYKSNIILDITIDSGGNISNDVINAACTGLYLNGRMDGFESKKKKILDRKLVYSEINSSLGLKMKILCKKVEFEFAK